MNRRPARILLALAGLVGALAVFQLSRVPSTREIKPPALNRSTEVLRGGADRFASPARLALPSSADTLESLLAEIQDQLDRPYARPQEAIVSFSSPEALQRFLDRAAAGGLKVIDQLDSLLMARVHYDSLRDLARDLTDHPRDHAGLEANPIVYTPAPPPAESRPDTRQVPFGDAMLNFLGVEGDHRTWGSDVTIAVLDSGVGADPTFDRGRLRHLDIGQGRVGGSDQDGHGTAVAALAAGAAPDAAGIAPAANLLSIRVTDAEGVSDAFTLSRAIVAAVDAGADIVNISMGAYSSTQALQSALGHAEAHGVAVVASAGNDQAAQLTWPAADPRVISVGSVDAAGQQVAFSNSGAGLKLSAPGYGIHTAWTEGERVSFSGTSASAPIVSGAIAAVMSQTPGLDGIEAAQIVAEHSSDTGAPGADPAYGHGILNLGWTMARNDPTRVDTAIGGHAYNADTGMIEIVVQNRGAQAVAGLELLIETDDGIRRQPVPWLNAAGIAISRVPANSSVNGGAEAQMIRTELVNPAGTVDAVPENNRKSSRFQPTVP